MWLQNWQGGGLGKRDIEAEIQRLKLAGDRVKVVCQFVGSSLFVSSWEDVHYIERLRPLL